MHMAFAAQDQDNDGYQIARDLATSGLHDLIASYYLCHVLQTMATTGLAERLIRASLPVPERELLLGFDNQIGTAMLRFLTIRGVVRSTSEGVEPTERGRLLMADVARGLLGYNLEAYGPVVARMSGLLSKAVIYGQDISRDFRALGEHCEVLARAFVTPLLLRALQAAGSRRVLDLGCGNGALLIDACLAVPSLTGIGLDIAPDIIELAKAKVETSRLEDRVEFVCADAFAPADWPRACEAADTWVMVGALHEHFRAGEDSVVSLLDEYAARMRATGAKLFCLVEPELHYDTRDANFYLCHALTRQGFPRDQVGWRSVFERSQFELRGVQHDPGQPFSFVQYELAPKGA